MIDLPKVYSWMIAAGKIALEYSQKKIEFRLKADHTLVTNADKAVEVFLFDKIQATYPDHEIIAEEGSEISGKKYSWVIDPIDGTAAFVWGIPNWCISIGVLRDMQPYLGMVYVPLTGEVYSVDHQGKATWNGEPIRASDNLSIDMDSLLCISPRTLQDYTLSFPGSVLSLGSGIIHSCLVARGLVVGALTLRPSIWDLAGVYPILKAAGATLCYLSGEPVDLARLSVDRKVSQPILVGHPGVIGRLSTMISRKG
jgi:myo-inositol-1(or 4)-monophosphatase